MTVDVYIYIHGIHTRVRFNDVDLDFESVWKARPTCFLSANKSLLNMFLIVIFLWFIPSCVTDVTLRGWKISSIYLSVYQSVMRWSVLWFRTRRLSLCSIGRQTFGYITMLIVLHFAVTVYDRDHRNARQIEYIILSPWLYSW